MKERKSEDDKAYRLTPQQRNTLKLMAKGLPNKEIAYRMGLTVSTVKQHISGIFVRLKVNTRTAAVVKAQQLGLIDRK